MRSQNMDRTRLVSVFLSVFTFILLEGFQPKSISNEGYFPFALLVCTIVSTILTAVSMMGLTENSNIRMLDNLYHAAAAPAMIISSVLFLISVFENKSYDTLDMFARRLASAILGLIYGLIMTNMTTILCIRFNNLSF